MRLKYSDIAAIRLKFVKEQGGICPLCLCKLDISDTKNPPVLDHNHTTGRVRFALHKFCNYFLGKIENNFARCLLNQDTLKTLLGNASDYIHDANEGKPFHPSYKTKEERKAAYANKRKRLNKRTSKADSDA